MTSPIQFDVNVPIGPSWRNVELLRTSILNCLAAIFQDHDFCTGLSMIVGELVENAIKYGDWSGDRRSFKISVRGDARAVQVRVSNPVRRDDPGAAAVTETIAWIRTFATPADAYRARLRQLAEADGGDAGVSQLGLVRIAYEGDCELAASIEDDVLTVRAASRVT